MNKYFRILVVIFSSAYFWYYARTYTEWHFIDNVNLIFHEAGHAIFSFFGMFVTVASGSGLQVAIPILISYYFFRKVQRISGALCLLWVGQNLLNISLYAGDSIAMQMDLLGGDSVIHDWNYLLTALGVLPYTSIIAGTIYAAGLMTIFVGTTLSLYYSWTTEQEYSRK